MKIIAKFSRGKIVAGTKNHVDLLVKLRAPAPAAEAKRPPLCIVPLVDVSGSMEGVKLVAVQKALTQLVAHLVPGDHMGLLAFDSEVQVLSPIVEITEARKIEFLSLIRGLRAGSSTNLAAGLIESARLVHSFAATPSQRVRVLLLTDGQANAGPARTAAELVNLVRETAVGVPISAFGYGDDCDHSLLAEIANASGGSFAYIKDDDTVMTAFAREIGGLLATYATAIKIHVRPLAGDELIQDLAELLYHGEQPAFFSFAIAGHSVATGAEAGVVEVSWTDGRGRPQSTQTVLRLDHVTADQADKIDDPAVARARDENILRRAQERAEAHAQQGKFSRARAEIEKAIQKLQDAALIAFAKSVLLGCYQAESDYVGTSGVRASSRAALANRRQVVAACEVDAVFQTSPSLAEAAMEASFRRKSRDV